MSIEDWNKLCNKDFVEHFSLPEPRKYFLHLSHFYKQGYNEESAIEELKAKDITQWEDTCYNAKDNFENLVAKNLRKTYLVKIAFEASCEKFIKIRSQALLLFGFRSHAKEILDLKSAIKAINTIVDNWYGYTIKIPVLSPRYHVDATIGETSTGEKKIPEFLTSLSSEFLIKNKSDIDTLILLLQQKFKMSQERLEQWRFKIAFELRDNQNY
ncbi:helicase: PROVISIONAL [Gigaspora margarita]|uniref:Helicase: PROVISIONAL n=1 Tax=Gigaspora margarita TaxID=4874 RepID=A0A8H4A9T5_GIGMA|nr:helicase: PROVISIONAL [Gigaspora margarita]